MKNDFDIYLSHDIGCKCSLCYRIEKDLGLDEPIGSSMDYPNDGAQARTSRESHADYVAEKFGGVDK